MTQCELRKKAADVIRTKGFSKRMLQNSQGECCILGALLIANGITLNLNRNGTMLYYNMFYTKDKLFSVIKDMGFRDYVEAYRFNDDENVTKEDVIEKLEKGCI